MAESTPLLEEADEEEKTFGFDRQTPVQEDVSS